MIKPFIITFAHCKGGVGKSTLCYHIAMLFLLYTSNVKIGVIDCDDIQNTTYNFFFSKNTNLQILYKINNIETLKNIIEHEELNILIVDTPGGNNDIIRYILQHTNVLITPVQHSLIDIEALIGLENNCIIPGPFSQIIRKNINQKAKWILVHNRLPLINIDEKYSQTLYRIAKFLNASVYELYDRIEYRISFEHRQTVNEIVYSSNNVNNSQLIAATQMKKIYDDIVFLYNLHCKI